MGSAERVPMKLREEVWHPSNNFHVRDGYYVSSANPDGLGTAVWSEVWRRILRLSPCLERKHMRAPLCVRVEGGGCHNTCCSLMSLILVGGIYFTFINLFILHIWDNG